MVVKKVDLLVEIGSEEIPASYVGPAVAALRDRVVEWMESSNLSHDPERVETFATPRRLAVRVGGLGSEQATREETRLGPAVKAAFDPSGNPTAAALGFARGAGVAVGDLQRVETDRGERIAALVRTGGKSARDLLLADGLLEKWTRLPFPKTMRWIPGDDFRYARPIRWVVLLLGEEAVPARLRHLTAGALSRGHRTLAPGEVEIRRPSDYERKLAEHHVVVRVEERQSRIESGAHRLAESLGGRLHEDPALVEEVTHLTEHPQPLSGSFDPELVKTLPAEVIITAMRSHQRYFSVEDAAGGLLPVFITFRDGGDTGLERVAQGNERVLRARLDDALFYWNEDCSRSSDEKLEDLERVVWLEGLGSVADKCRRIAKLAEALREEWGLEGVDPTQLHRAALLSKSDLATEMIRDGKEFTKLQGIMGRYYALEAGELEEVADAIAEHLYPKHARDRLPLGELAMLVGLADRFDSIAGSLLAGFAPTGSQDPYALRRQSLAILRMLIERERHLDLEVWLDRSLEGFEAEEDAREVARTQGLDLFGGRIESMLEDLPVEIVRGILAVRRADPLAIVGAARSLSELAGSDSFQSLLAGAKRCRNLLLKEKRLEEEACEAPRRPARLRKLAAETFQRWFDHVQNGAALSFEAASFQDPAEEKLYSAVVAAVPELHEAFESDDATAAYRVLSSLGPTIDEYFETVLVNAPDPGLRNNRLGFLQDLHYLFVFWADLASIPSA